MTGLIRRWSFWCLLALTVLALFGESLFDHRPGQPVASPFCKPLWLSRDQPPTTSLTLNRDTPELSLDWRYSPPSGLSIAVDDSAGDTGLFVEIVKPGEPPLQLAPLTGGFRADGRDIAFKRSLGLPPFKDAAASLFDRRGEYLISVSGAGDFDGSVTIRLEGGRWGLLGTDQRGRDVAALFTAGVRVSLIVGLFAALLATFLGTSVGLAAGYLGGWTDVLAMRLVDLLLSIPLLPVLMALAAMWGKGLWQLVLILSVFSWMSTARTVRSLILSLRDAPYIEGLRGLGARSGYILRRHLLPETFPVLLATMTLGVPGAILSEAGLSFLGLSDPRVISWGRMLHEAHSFGAFTAGAWWLLLPPGLGITLLCLAFQDLGKHLEERVDPRLRGARR
ncbi:MAG: ABC transporter permease [Synergistaceae bacterium]|nr:ABC transporter permease [Synergistota bacterium]NLM71001.1 ABC transporter permease [Synergistaceae bacterium]